MSAMDAEEVGCPLLVTLTALHASILSWLPMSSQSEKSPSFSRWPALPGLVRFCDYPSIRYVIIFINKPTTISRSVIVDLGLHRPLRLRDVALVLPLLEAAALVVEELLEVVSGAHAVLPGPGLQVAHPKGNRVVLSHRLCELHQHEAFFCRGLQRLVVRSHQLLGHHHPLLAFFVLEVDVAQQKSQGLVAVKIASGIEVVPKSEVVCSQKASEVHFFFTLAGHNAFPAKGYPFLGKKVDFSSAVKQG